MSLIVPIDTVRKSRKQNSPSLEYELISSLAFQQFAGKEGPDYQMLLSIPLLDRIPALIQEYGLKRMHKLIRSMITEFCLAIKLPKNKKLTETRISAIACDIILTAEEDQFSIEDLIVFFEFVKRGRWGILNNPLTHYFLMQQLESYRQERHEAYVDIRESQAAEVSMLGPTDRICPEPTPIKLLFEQTGKVVSFRKIS